MRNEMVFIWILALVIIISGCAQETPKTVREANVCGDDICGATEDCSNCAEDCGCKSGEYCSDTGICRGDVCGDDICSAEENRTQTCCEDCGCLLNKICNKVTQMCQEKATISEEKIRKAANDYMDENKIRGTIIGIKDAYYKDEILKQVNIDCRAEEIPYPCAIILYIDDEGKIVEEIRTS
ncbi:MAG: hypothetical protein U9Q92_06905 [archaeon]|nr:hypothetical protein [archaeon]